MAETTETTETTTRTRLFGRRYHWSRRLVLGRAAALGAIAPLAGANVVGGCGLGAGEAERTAALDGPPVEVVFMRTANQSLADAYHAQAAAFNQRQQRIRARFEAPALAQGEAWDAKLTAMLASDSAPDCFLVPQDVLPGTAATGALMVLDPYLKRDAREVDAGDFFPSHLAGGKWQGKQVALTPDGCALLTYYNLTLFQQAGVPAPKPTWTWTEYLDAARRLTVKDASGQVVQAGAIPTNSTNQFWLWLWSNSADLLSDDLKRVRLTEPASLEALQFLADAVVRHGVAPSSPGVSLGANPEVAGKVGMWQANRGFFGNLQQVTSFKFNVTPFPRAPRANASVTVTTPGHIAMARANKRADAAWEWHKFLTGTEAQIIRSKVQQGGCPSRKSATQDRSYADLTLPALESPAANKTFADVLTDPKTARFIPQYVGMNEAMAIFNRHFGAALRGEQSVPAAVDIAKREIEDLLRRQPQPTG
jgi:multiple sugar transport system substrate-binding protein